jgi:hypothetical protein
VTVGWIAQAIVGHVLAPSRAGIMRGEVKCCSMSQAWSPQRTGGAQWRCAEIGEVWDPDTGKFRSTERHRPADLWVFMLRDGPPFDADSYEAAALSTDELVAVLKQPSRRTVMRAMLETAQPLAPLEQLTTRIGALAAG